jgi:alpha-glucoside transport system ATP-binding protein
VKRPPKAAADPILDRLPKALSGGQRQRVAIGRSIVRDPKVYLFDEPLSNLDAALRVATRIEIAQLKEQMPESTMIYVTHDQVEAMTLATASWCWPGAASRRWARRWTLYEKARLEFVAQFIGSPAMNHRRQRHHRLRQWQVGRNRDCRSRRGQGQEGVLRRQAGRPGGDHR